MAGTFWNASDFANEDSRETSETKTENSRSFVSSTTSKTYVHFAAAYRSQECIWLCRELGMLVRDRKLWDSLSQTFEGFDRICLARNIHVILSYSERSLGIDGVSGAEFTLVIGICSGKTKC